MYQRCGRSFFEDAVGATSSHEMEHATNPQNIKNSHDYAEKKRTDPDYEKNVEDRPNEVEQQDLNERTNSQLCVA